MSQSPLASADTWNLVSSGYLTDVVASLERYSEYALQQVDLNASSIIADVACGPGTLVLQAASRVGKVIAIDFAQNMIDHLQAALANRQIQNVEAYVSDAQHLPFADQTFDAVFSMFGLMFFPDRHQGLCELFRVLKLGCKAIVSSWPPPSAVQAFAVMGQALREVLPDQPTNTSKPPLSTPDEYQVEMSAAGFENIEVHRVTFANEYENVNALVDSLERSSTPLVLLKKRIGAEAFAPVVSTIRAHMHRAFGDGGVRVEMPAFIGVGVRPAI